MVMVKIAGYGSSTLSTKYEEMPRRREGRAGFAGVL